MGFEPEYATPSHDKGCEARNEPGSQKCSESRREGYETGYETGCEEGGVKPGMKPPQSIGGMKPVRIPGRRNDRNLYASAMKPGMIPAM